MTLHAVLFQRGRGGGRRLQVIHHQGTSAGSGLGFWSEFGHSWSCSSNALAHSGPCPTDVPSSFWIAVTVHWLCRLEDATCEMFCPRVLPPRDLHSSRPRNSRSPLRARLDCPSRSQDRVIVLGSESGKSADFVLSKANSDRGLWVRYQ